MMNLPHIDPVAFHIGNFAVHWYGLSYLFGIGIGWLLLRWRLQTSSQPSFTLDELNDIVFYASLGAIVGGRLGYILFYDFSYFLSHPWFLFQTWKGGMSFHGGLLGLTFSLLFWAHRAKKNLWDIGDFMVPVVPIGLGAGRIGNFINGELWGRVTDSPLGMIFPSAGNLPRHPSQLYEFFLEGVVLFAVLWIVSMRKWERGVITGLFFILYGIFRILVEFFREPDPQVGYFAGWITEGQLLSLPMIFAGILLWSAACARGIKKCSST